MDKKPTEMTFKELREELGVSRQRAHQIVKTYGCITRLISPRKRVMERSEMKKIPKNRPDGQTRKYLEYGFPPR